MTQIRSAIYLLTQTHVIIPTLLSRLFRTKSLWDELCNKYQPVRTITVLLNVPDPLFPLFVHWSQPTTSTNNTTATSNAITMTAKRQQGQKARPTNGRRRKVDRPQYRRTDIASIPPSDRVTRSMTARARQIRRINCRFRIPGTDKIEYWRGGQRMVCPPGVKPWER
ncbi:MAG: hypothetical protein Q9216_002452 [Gyalolechia sp. 2 TL-2023]